MSRLNKTIASLPRGTKLSISRYLKFKQWCKLLETNVRAIRFLFLLTGIEYQDEDIDRLYASINNKLDSIK